MKKLLILVILIFTLFGCQSESDSTEVSFESIHPQYEGYATNITIEETNFNETLPQKAFTVDIISIIYSPIIRRVEIEYKITDNYYQNALYLTVKKVGLNDEKIQHVLNSRSQTFKEKFNNVDLSGDFQILFGKFDGDDLNPSPNAIAVKTLTLFDKKKDERHQVFLSSQTITDFKLGATESHIRMNYALQDEDEMIEKLDVVLIENVTHFEIEKISLSMEDLVREGNTLSFSELTFTKAKPGIKYDIIVVAAGNDGIDDFEEIVINVFNHTTSS